MYSHVVHVFRKEVTPWDIDVRSPGAARQALANYANRYHVKIDANIESNVFSNMETWYCHNRASADVLALKLANEVPGREIYVLELKSITISPPSTPIVSIISDKGMLPK
jgi:hypothetical protein